MSALSRLRKMAQNMSTSTAHVKPVVLYAWRTPNGFKPAILLEELKAAYPGFDYDLKGVDIGKANEQKQSSYLAINPNGKIPALTDHTRNDFNVFESAAILFYLEQHYDKDRKFGFDPNTEPEAWSEVQQWILFAHGGVGPMLGQAAHFRFASEKIEYATNRYLTEAKRLHDVLETRLKDREYLAGPGKGKYSIADINVFPWINAAHYAGIENQGEWPSLQAWVERVKARPAVQAGLSILE